MVIITSTPVGLEYGGRARGKSCRCSPEHGDWVRMIVSDWLFNFKISAD